MATLRALVLEKAKKRLVIVENRAVPLPGPSQVQVKVLIAGLNGHDQKIRDLGMFLDRIGTSAVIGMMSLAKSSQLAKR